jgi:hypothetical protein
MSTSEYSTDRLLELTEPPVLFFLPTLFQLHVLHSVQRDEEIICCLVSRLFLNCVGCTEANETMIMNDKLGIKECLCETGQKHPKKHVSA